MSHSQDDGIGEIVRRRPPMPRKTMPIQWDDNWQRLFDAGDGEERDTYRRQMVEGLQRDAYEEGDAAGYRRGLEAGAGSLDDSEKGDTWNSYNEGWNDALDHSQQRIRALLPEEDNED